MLIHCLFQAEYDAMLQEYAGEGIPLVTSSVPADQFAPYLHDLLPLLMTKTVSLKALRRTTEVHTLSRIPPRKWVTFILEWLIFLLIFFIIFKEIHLHRG